jgi:hypothetical protein
MDPELWYLKCRLRGGCERVFPVSGPDKQRLWYAVQQGTHEGFAVFQSEANEVALNLDHVLYAHFLFEAPNIIVDVDQDEEDAHARVLFAGETEYHDFEVDADDPEPAAEDEEDDGQLRQLLFMLGLSTEAHDVLSFMDVDGETVFIRASDIAVMEVPLWALYPELDVDHGDDDEELGGGPNATTD